MSTASVSLAGGGRVDATKVLTAGVVVGVLDGLFAVGMWTVALKLISAGRVFQGVARGLLGRAALDGGAATVALGIAIHFAIACTWAFVYYLIYRRSAGLRRLVASTGGAVVVGMVYGMLVWLAMDFVVLPLSAAPPMPVSGRFVAMLVGHAFVVGLPIALIVRAKPAS